MYHYEIGDLFDVRNVVGRKLECLLAEQGISKSSVCAGAGFSRPTLDKILAGKVTSKANFEKHISKLLAFLELTPNELMGGVPNPFNSMQQLRDVQHLDLQELSQNTGISIEELKKIEAGENAPLYELRDLAAYLGTGVRDLLGKNFFQTTISTIDALLQNDKDTIRSPGGFWGHCGILLKGHPKFMWFPITAYTRSLVCRGQEQEYMVLPCMNNCLLLLNTSNILEMALLDDACDAPDDMDWDANVDCGSLPAVFYESIHDYQQYLARGSDPRKDDLSETFAAAMEHTMQHFALDVDACAAEAHALTVYFSDGGCRTHCLDYCEENTIAYPIREIYEMGKPLDSGSLCFQSDESQDIFINLRNVSMIKMPLEKVEAAILDSFEEVPL